MGIMLKMATERCINRILIHQRYDWISRISSIARHFSSSPIVCTKYSDDRGTPEELYYDTTKVYDKQFENRIFFIPKKERTYSEKLLFFMQQKFDFSWSGMRRWVEKEKQHQLIYEQKYDPDTRKQMGPDQNAAYIVLKLKGAFKFSGQFMKWINLKNVDQYPIPNYFISTLHLEAVDLSETNICYEGLENLVYCRTLASLNLRKCSLIDDWCLDRISGSRFRFSLSHLDLSECPQITERGLSVLHRFTSLKTLNLYGLTNVKHIELMCLMLEDVLPNCKITGVNYWKQELLDLQSEILNDEKTHSSEESSANPIPVSVSLRK